MNRGAILFACLAALVVGYSPPADAGGLKTAIIDDAAFGGPESDLAFDRVKDAGASMVRVGLYWRGVAPGPTKPAGFVATDPADHNYDWQALDQKVKAAVARGLEPLVSIQSAPEWAEGSGSGPQGTVRPNPVDFGEFAQAAAARYNGSFDPDGPDPLPVLPRVRYWQAWNEPNRSYFLSPQYVGGKLFAPGWYRKMVNRFSTGVHAIAADNVVVAGGLAPFGHGVQPAPMAFMRKMLCMSKVPYHPVCPYTSNFNVWSAHPYTCGPPTHHALAPDDVSMGDLPEMRALLRAGVRRHRVVSTQPVGFWVTEISWDTNPPDPKGVPLRLHARWVADALYRMWKTGVGVATWFSLRDNPFPSPYQSGFYFYRTPSLTEDVPKTLSLQAFRFPFVAFVRSGRVFVWGRTPPAGASLPVVIERRTSSGWRRVGIRVANGYGIFSHVYAIRTTGSLRARVTLANNTVVSATSFALKAPRQPLICPFGL